MSWEPCKPVLITAVSYPRDIVHKASELQDAGMHISSSFGVIATVFYMGGVIGFLGGFLANATVLRGYRQEAAELRRRLSAQ